MGGKIREMAAAAAALLSVLVVGAFPGCSQSVHKTVKACIQAKVGGKVVCLRPGERCQSRHERIYRSYGLTCRIGILRERNFVGPANP
jgi:hypothetical protein